MNKLTTDIKALHEETLNNLKTSKANNTLRAYKSDYKDFAGFCVKHGFKPMPSDPKIISLYLTYLSKTSKISTLRRRLVSIGVVHKLKGHYLDTKHPVIIENLMGIKRVKGSKQVGKKPILINHLKQIINVINQQDIEEIVKLRNKTLILIGFGGGFRRTELISIDYEDLEFVDEGFGALDPQNLEAVTSLLHRLKAYYRLIMVISHVDVIKDSVDNVVEITKTGKDSKVVYV